MRFLQHLFTAAFSVCVLSIITGMAHAACNTAYWEEVLTFPTSDGNSTGYYGHGGSTSNATSPITLSTGEWRVSWDSGVVRGEALCNGTKGTSNSTSGQSDSWTNGANGASCWCKITEWIPTGGSVKSVSAKWVYYATALFGSFCKSNCASDCASQMKGTANFRSAAFGSVEPICHACTNKPANSVYSGSATGGDNCPYTCNAGYYKEGGDITTPTSNGNSTGYNTHNLSNSSNATSPVNLSAGQWRVTWNSIGTVVGEATCNNTQGTTNSTEGQSDAWINENTGESCWCRITGWMPNGGSVKSLTAKWVYYDTAWIPGFCGQACASDCASRVSTVSAFRSAAFESIQQPCNNCPDGGSSSAGSTSITQCYIPSTTSLSDAKGAYHFTNTCNYSE